MQRNSQEIRHLIRPAAVANGELQKATVDDVQVFAVSVIRFANETTISPNSSQNSAVIAIIDAGLLVFFLSFSFVCFVADLFFFRRLEFHDQIM